MSAPFTPEQEARIAEIVSEVICASIRQEAHERAAMVASEAADISYRYANGERVQNG
ncbi:hypothetical protein J2X47_002001 [Sphingomonas sp. BE270]|jgi:hypothetical protein|uniref:hypothetical protein n=1 Tax=Sphingomonas sp. BE270 TaxID=2817726 RepID=UPI00285B279B|nr:hypothetical protein [Sphingomonas sp. BE270]MDR7257821.1 hypothetical protein [Sphingomonas sp. BE270]